MNNNNMKTSKLFITAILLLFMSSIPAELLCQNIEVTDGGQTYSVNLTKKTIKNKANVLFGNIPKTCFDYSVEINLTYGNDHRQVMAQFFSQVERNTYPDENVRIGFFAICDKTGSIKEVWFRFSNIDYTPHLLTQIRQCEAALKDTHVTLLNSCESQEYYLFAGSLVFSEL